MKNKNKIFFGIIIIIILIFSYKIYAPFSIQNFKALNMKNMTNIKKTEKQAEDNKYKFAVVGNIKNSIRIFDKKILVDLKKRDIDFIISSGNNVSDSGEGKYRVL